MNEKDATRRHQSRYAAGQVDIDEVWTRDRLGLLNVPISMLDDTEYAPAPHDPNQLELSLDMPVTMEPGALDVQVGGGHYKGMKIQPVEFIHANGIGYFEGNVIKYVTRWRAKGGVADLEKARHYIDLLIELEGK